MANYPGSASTDANLFVASNNLATVIVGALIASGDNTSGNGLRVVSTTSFPTTGYVTIDSEAIAYTGISTYGGNPVFTGLTRGADGTVAASHNDSSTAYHDVVAAHHNVLKDEVVAIETDLLGSVKTNLSNILVNGGFEFWQRGVSFVGPLITKYTADRWKVYTNDAANATVTREASTIDSGVYSMKVVVSGTPSSKVWTTNQCVENYKEYAGKTISASARVYCSVASAVKLTLSDGIGVTKSSYHTGGGGWETLTVTRTISASNTSLLVELGMYDSGDMKNGTYYFDSAMLSVGSAAPTFVPKNYQTELAQCMRYYQTSTFDVNRSIPLYYSNPNDYFYYNIYFKVPMYANPTMTYNGGSAVSTNLYTLPSSPAASIAGPSLVLTNPGSGTSNHVAGYTAAAHQTVHDLFAVTSGSWTAEAEL